MRRVQGDGVELAVVDEGSGPPVLLLHGFPDSSACGATRSPRWSTPATARSRRTCAGSASPTGPQDVRRLRRPAQRGGHARGARRARGRARARRGARLGRRGRVGARRVRERARRAPGGALGRPPERAAAPDDRAARAQLVSAAVPVRGHRRGAADARRLAALPRVDARRRRHRARDRRPLAPGRADGGAQLVPRELAARRRAARAPTVPDRGGGHAGHLERPATTTWSRSR